MAAARPGALFDLIANADLPPAEAPLPVLTESEVLEVALPPITKSRSGSSPHSIGSGASSKVTFLISFSYLVFFVVPLLL